MAETTKVLKLVFRDSLGKNRSWKIPYPKDDLTKEVILQHMNALAKTKLFAKDGAMMLAHPLSAAFISTTVDGVAEKIDFE